MDSIGFLKEHWISRCPERPLDFQGTLKDHWISRATLKDHWISRATTRVRSYNTRQANTISWYCTGVPLRSPWSLYTIAIKRVITGTTMYVILILQIQIDNHVAILPL